MSKRTMYLILIGYITILHVTNGQKACEFLSTSNYTSALTKNGTKVFINSFSANKCLRIRNFGHYPSQLKLDQCFWTRSSLNSLVSDEQLMFRRNSLSSEGYTIYNNAGLGEKYCLSLGRDGFLKTANCQSKSWDQLWKLRPIKNTSNQFLIKQGSSQLCVIPQYGSTRTGSKITLGSCNSYQTEQRWKLCSL